MLNSRLQLQVLLIAVLFCTGSAVVIGGHHFFLTRFYPGLQIANVSIGSLTHEQAKTKLQTHLPELPLSTVTISVPDSEVSVSSSSAQLQLDYNLDASLTQAFAWGRSVHPFVRAINALSSIWQQPSIDLGYSFDTTQAEQMVAILAAEFDQPGEYPQATLIITDTPSSLELSFGSEGAVLNQAATLDKLKQSAVPADITVTAVVESSGLELNPEQHQMAVERATRLVAAQLEGQVDTIKVYATDQDLVSLLSFPTGLDSARVADFVKNWAEIIDRPAQNAVFDYDRDTLQVSEFQPHHDGLELNQVEVAAQLAAAISTLETTLSTKQESDTESDSPQQPLQLAVSRTPPTTTLADTNQIGIAEVIGFGDSFYNGSIPSRVHNVGITAEKLDWTIIAPGQEFQFNRELGEVSRRTGYQPAYVIKGNQTVLGDGGGVCQASTTLFRSILDSGLDITRRLPHSYRVSYYEQNDQPGFDATVYAGAVDLRFVNDTEHHVLIDMEVDEPDRYMTVTLYGTSDGRTSEITDYRKWNYRPPLPTQYIPDPNLPPGTTRQIDWAVAGLQTEFTHTVYAKNGEVLHQNTYTSNYRPWAAKFLVGE